MAIPVKHFLLSVFCWISLLLIGYHQQSNGFIHKCTISAQRQLDELTAKAVQLIERSTQPAQTGMALDKMGIGFSVYSSDSMTYWNESYLIQDHSKNHFITIDGRSTYSYTVKKNNTTLHLEIPVLAQPAITEEHQITTQLFAPDRSSSLFIVPQETLALWLQWILLSLYLIGLVSGIISISLLARLWIGRKKIIQAILFFTISIFALRLFSLFPGYPTAITDIDLFDRSIRPSLLSPTLADLIINVGILCVLVWFVRTYIKPTYFYTPGKRNITIAVLNYILVYLSALVMFYIFRQLVVGSGLSFDFEHIFYLDLKSFIALTAILILAISLFILDLHLLRIIRYTKLTIKQRVLVNIASLIGVMPIVYLLDLPFSVNLILGLAIYLTLLDISIDYYKPHAIWYLTWTMTGSILISTFLYRFHMEKEMDQRKALGIELKNELLKHKYDSHQSLELLVNNLLNKEEAQTSYLGMYEAKVITTHIPPPSKKYSVYVPIDAAMGFYLTKKSNQVFKAVSFFSYIFILFNVILLTFVFLNTRFHWFSFSIFRIFQSRQTLRYRIQTSMLLMSVGSFVFIACVIIVYISQQTSVWQKDVNHDLRLLNVESLSGTYGYKVYDAQGWLLPDKNKRLTFADWTWIQTQPSMPEGLQHHISSTGQKYYVEEDPAASRQHLKRKLNDFIGTLLNVYVFLLIVIALVSILVANSISKPLTILSSKLKQIQIGGSNQKLEWNQQDELGGLIRNYNEMIQQLDRSTRMLALTERETAWREMAKQVAHEIKNPLTPMKLITQHLQNSIQRAEPDEVPALVKRVTQTLIEQIENLSKIASEFSNFAKLPAPENEKLTLNEVVTSTHDLFRKRDDMDIHLRVPIDEIYVFADKNHIIRVLTNLIKNAIQAIPLGRRGRIEIMLYKLNERAIIKVIDNGCGIPDSMKDKVFYPNFTTKNSGTGLGLAIVRDIIDSCNGHIYFHTAENKGTEFFVELPLMHMEDNFKEIQRVSL